MRPVHNETELPTAFGSAQAEAIGAFGNGALYMEKLILGGRHIRFR